MGKRMPMLYSALMLTGVNLLLRFAGTSFQVYIGASLGAAGVGLLQLVMSVGNLAMVAGIAGVRTATMYLTAEELGRGRAERLRCVLSQCVRYSVVCSGTVAAALYLCAPYIATHWIADEASTQSLRLFCAFLPVNCLCGVMTGYFTGANRIGTLVAVEVAEQLFGIALTLLFLKFWASGDPGRSCMSVILGSGLGSVLTLCALSILCRREKQSGGCSPAPRAGLLRVAVPLAIADDLRAGIGTTENLMVPRRLALCGEIADPLGAFGMLSGMVFPIMMFPACILYSLCELLIPELARCNASGGRERIRYLSRQSMRIALLYGLFACGIEFLLADRIGLRLYQNAQVGTGLRQYAWMIPMLYCDTVTDAINKGLGKQKLCVRFNIATSALDVILLFALLPRYGLRGYLFSFAVTHAINFILSIALLVKSAQIAFPLHVPLLAAAATALCVTLAMHVEAALGQVVCFCLTLGTLLFLLGITGKDDLVWVRGLVRK